MAKRFTETDKWRDTWFRKLTPAYKLAWVYLLDNCDHAGVIDLDEEMAEFQIGDTVDWSAFIEASLGRVVLLDNGRLWLTGFIAYQYGVLSPTCPAHGPVFRSVEKNSIPMEGYPKGIQRVSSTLKDKDKDKDKDKGKDTEGGVGETKPPVSVPVPDLTPIVSPRLREAAGDWLAYKRERREPYKPRGLAACISRIVSLEAEHGESAVCDAIQRAMAAGWKGFDHDVGRASVARAGPAAEPYRPGASALKKLGIRP